MPVISLLTPEETQLVYWLQHDDPRMYALHMALKVAQEHRLTEWLLAAGFLRNLVWDKLHGVESTRLNDIDFIYYCHQDVSLERDKRIEASLRAHNPDLPWSVKNQARMHSQNGDKAYINLKDAMAHWPEKETALGVRLEANLVSFEFHLESAFGLESLFQLRLTHNPLREYRHFKERLTKKHWLERYPKLTLVY